VNFLHRSLYAFFYALSCEHKQENDVMCQLCWLRLGIRDVAGLNVILGAREVHARTCSFVKPRASPLG